MRDRTLLAVVAAFTLTVCLLLLSTWACVRILSGVRAYVGGESLYSKAQKNAVYFLDLYVGTRSESWFTKFDQSLRVPEGDRDARLELERSSPDWNVVRRGFITGGNSPDDVDDLIFVFRRLGSTPYVSAAINIWTQGDAEIAKLRELGKRIRQQPDATANSVEIEALNSRLTTLEDQFSATLGAGARSTGTALMIAFVVLSIVLWATGVWILQRLLSVVARERETLRATIENAPLGIVLVDAPDGRIRMSNARVWQLLGQEPAVGTGPEEARASQAQTFDRTRRQWRDDPVAEAMAGQIVSARNLQFHCPDRDSMWLRVSAAPIHRGDRVAGAVITFQDISEERKVEDAMVRQSQDLARSNADLEQFAYTTSHDLQEPLRNIAVFSELLARNYGDRLDADGDKVLHVITSSVARMSALIRDLLAYSRVANLDAAPRSPVDLNRIFEWACSNLSAKIMESRATVDADPLPIVRCDQVQMVQVFQNLIDNAIKYAGGRQPVVHISAEQRGAEWRITVKDNGTGIDPAYHQQVFGIFKRLHGRDVPGTGIGLALTKRVVERHGGHIWVEANVPRGTTFAFTLPDIADSESSDSPAAVAFGTNPVHAASGASATTSRKRD